MSQPIVHRDFDQHSPQWYAAKAGKWSGSNAAIIMGGLDTSGLASLIKDLAWERVYGPTPGGFKSPAMERGNEVEPEARLWYEREHGVAVEQVGLVTHATLPNVVWSPDGLVTAKKAIEAKCPLHKAMMEVMRTNKVPSEYRWQTKWGMWVGQLDEEDFVAYHPLCGGLVIPCAVTDAEKEQMAERVEFLEPKVSYWMEIIGDRKNSLQVNREPVFAYDDPAAHF